MTGPAYDVVVVGCGAAGTSAAWWCARRGLRVLGVDRFEPGHRRGSSHGTERIVRLGHDDPVYAQFAVEALARWGEVEDASGVPLLDRCGALDVGFADELAHIEATTTALGVAMEHWDAAEVARRFPGFAFTGDALFQPDAGTVHAERAVAVLRRLAVAEGARFRDTCQVRGVEQRPAGVVVDLGAERVTAACAVVTTGAWADSVLTGVLDLPGFRVTKEQLAYFRPRATVPWPAFLARGSLRHYGMTTPEGLVKVAEHHTGPVVDPDTRTFELEPTTWDRLLAWVGEHLPGVDPAPVDAATCLYASTPDEDFVLDRVGDIVVGVGLSGHGFKFVPEIGRRLADLADGSGWAGNPFAIGHAARPLGRSGHH